MCLIFKAKPGFHRLPSKSLQFYGKCLFLTKKATSFMLHNAVYAAIADSKTVANKRYVKITSYNSFLHLQQIKCSLFLGSNN